MSAHNLEGPLTTDSLGTKGLPFVPGSLHLTTSKHTGRYDATATVEPENMRIEPGMFVSTKEPVPNYLPPQWSAHVHPEGQLYFYRHAELRVVTEAYIYAPQIMEKVIHWVREIEALLLRKQVVLSDDIELFLQIDDNDCAYYFIDHLSHTEFWLDAADTETLCLLPAVTPSHLRLALQELYWIHVEYFPMHTKGLAPSVIEELITIFSHALADHMTSRTSTFPYAESDCAKFLKLLRGSRSQVRDGHTICVIARLWHLVYNHRFSTHYGEQHARLSRNQAILVDTTQKSCRLQTLISLLSFKTSDRYLSRLDDIYTDHLVYAHQWQPFMARCMRDWNSLSYLALFALMLHILLNFIPTFRMLSFLSAACFGASFISSILLVHHHQELEDATASEALRYLNGIRSDNFRFQWVAFTYSLPKAFYFWGISGFTSNCICAAIMLTSTGYSTWMAYFLGLICLCALALLAFLNSTSCKKFLCIPLFKWRSLGGDDLPV